VLCIPVEIVHSQMVHRSFAYVTFADADAAQRAVETMNQTELEGRTVRVELENRKPKAAKRRPRRNRRRRTDGDDA